MLLGENKETAMAYVDGFVMLVPKKNLKAYAAMAKKACVVWMEHGALDYRECVGDDLKVKWGRSFEKIAKPGTGDAIVFSYIRYESKAHRNAVNKKVMKDPRLAAMMDPKKMPFDMKKMSYGGFKVLVGS
jgi:uncharacterized protein YbaA (DUF1428 family)